MFGVEWMKELSSDAERFQRVKKSIYFLSISDTNQIWWEKSLQKGKRLAGGQL